jgi:hypothetical protein
MLEKSIFEIEDNKKIYSGKMKPCSLPNDTLSIVI